MMLQSKDPQSFHMKLLVLGRYSTQHYQMMNYSLRFFLQIGQFFSSFFFLSRIRSLWALSNSSKRTLVFTLASLSTTNDNDSCHFLCNSTITYIMIKNKTPQPRKYLLQLKQLTSPFLNNISFGFGDTKLTYTPLTFCATPSKSFLC